MALSKPTGGWARLWFALVDPGGRAVEPPRQVGRRLASLVDRVSARAAEIVRGPWSVDRRPDDSLHQVQLLCVGGRPPGDEERRQAEAFFALVLQGDRTRAGGAGEACP
jgi:hypothetical protein